MPGLQADSLFACLERHDVRYVLVGGLAAVLHGSPLPTLDADICPARDVQNLTRLAAALDEIDARIRTADTVEGVRFPRDAAFLGGIELLNLVTNLGDLDLTFVPAGTRGFTELAPNAVPITVLGVTVQVAALEDVIRSKEAANRAKDRLSLPVLRELQKEIQRQQAERPG